MACRSVAVPGGGVAIVCTRGERPRRCAVCGAPGATLLCDGPPRTPKAKTCDRPLCVRCAVRRAPDQDYCPEHAPPTAVPWRDQAVALGWSRQDLDLLAWDETHQRPGPWRTVEVHAHWIVVRTTDGHIRSHLPGRVVAGPCRHYSLAEEPAAPTASPTPPERPTEAPAPAVALVLDTETTGLLGPGCHLVEIGVWVVDLAAGTLGLGGARLIRPPAPIPTAATAAHGIRDAHVVEAPVFAEVWPKLTAWVERLRPTWVIAHNAPFDRGVLSLELERAGLPVPPWPWACSMAWVKALRPGLRSYALGELARAAGAAPGGHRAQGDCRALAEVLRWALQGRDPRTVAPRVTTWRAAEPEAPEVPRTPRQMQLVGGGPV